MPAPSLDAVVNLCKRRGFIVQSSEIYGGAAAAYDYGPLGVEVKNALKQLWWREMTVAHENIVGLDAAVFMHPKVWEASGHVEAFADPLVECKKCHRRFRADEIGEPSTKNKKHACPQCGAEDSFTERRQFNLMFRTHLGPAEDAQSLVYLRPETAQGIYVDAPYLQAVMRLKLPFGIAQIGKAFRNEITPGPFIFRTVEFEQAEMQYFVKPKEASRWFRFWRDERLRWFHETLGFPKASLRLHAHETQALAHYAKEAADMQYDFPTLGWQECEGIHNRGDYDLARHQEYSGKDLTLFDAETKEKILPWIVETSAGVDRMLLALLCQTYTEETVKEGGAAGRGAGEKRAVLKLPPSLAPVQVAVFPLLSNHDQLVGKARAIASALRTVPGTVSAEHPGAGLRRETVPDTFRVQYDDAGAVGRRYRRQDEIGTPFCVTADHQTLSDDTVTVRNRDTMKQERVALRDLPVWLAQHLV